MVARERPRVFKYRTGGFGPSSRTRTEERTTNVFKGKWRCWYWMSTADDLVLAELMLNRFRRLVAELQRGSITRNDFQPWEIELLLDIETCQLERKRKADILRQYQRAVERQLEMGSGPPMKLSEFLQLRAKREEPTT
jgi:hypothetical protein